MLTGTSETFSINGSNEFVLIDHGHALTGPNWDPSHLSNAGVVVANRLLADKAGTLSQIERYQWRNVANTEAQRYQAVDFAKLALDCQMTKFASQGAADAACEFLKLRVEKMVALISHKLGLGSLFP